MRRQQLENDIALVAMALVSASNTADQELVHARRKRLHQLSAQYVQVTEEIEAMGERETLTALEPITLEQTTAS